MQCHSIRFSSPPAYGVFGEHKPPVRIAQNAIDVVTCLLVGFVAFTLAPTHLKQRSGMIALLIYGWFSWFTLFWPRYILTETLAIFLTVAAVATTIIALRGRPRYWAITGAICGLAILTRPDSLLALNRLLLTSIKTR
jgi:4-amino-4-deoxy-L-arabinose transferase-like glycosyltransferase